MKIKCLSILFAGWLLVSSQPCFSQLSSGESAVIAEFGKQLTGDIEKDNLNGSISASIIKNYRVIWAGAFGNARVSNAADTSTIYRIGSITKTFTVVILMQLVEEGKVQLDDPVENYIPEIRSLKGYSDNTKITLHQLASHTAGLEREPAKADASIGPVEEWESKTLACIPYTSFSSSPGTQFLYSNIGFALLGLALERASGVPYIQMVKEKIFMPLHMDDTFFSMPENKMARLAQGIDNNDLNHINMSRPVQDLIGRGYRVPNGGIYSTPLDLSKFVIALAQRKVLLNPRSFREMEIIPPGGKNYGLGLGIGKNMQVEFIGHDGSVPGYTAAFMIEKYKGYAVVLMRNYNNGSTNLSAASRNLLIKLVKAG